MTCQNATDESGIGLRCARQCLPAILLWKSRASDGKLAPANMSTPALRPIDIRNKATLDKMRQKHKTRLGRFITSPRRLAALRLPRRHLNFRSLFWGQTPCYVGPGPKKCAKNAKLFRCYSQLSLECQKMRI